MTGQVLSIGDVPCRRHLRLVGADWIRRKVLASRDVGIKSRPTNIIYLNRWRAASRYNYYLIAICHIPVHFAYNQRLRIAVNVKPAFDIIVSGVDYSPAIDVPLRHVEAVAVPAGIGIVILTEAPDDACVG